MNYRCWMIAALTLQLNLVAQAVPYEDPKVGFWMHQQATREHGLRADPNVSRHAWWTFNLGANRVGRVRCDHLINPQHLSATQCAQAWCKEKTEESNASDLKFGVDTKPVTVAGVAAARCWGNESLGSTLHKVGETTTYSHKGMEIHRDVTAGGTGYTRASWAYFIPESDGEMLQLSFAFQEFDSELDPEQLKMFKTEVVGRVIDSVKLYDAAHPAPNPEPQEPDYKPEEPSKPIDPSRFKRKNR